MDMAAAFAELELIEDDNMRKAMAFLISKGLLIDTGERRDGLIVWMANTDVSVEELRFLLDHAEQ